ncbi:unnamed protein product [Microthlaspi erraticum]|uniref:Uncharacterized protein n=1 Tax=Microthlaspi erraticum TaxID=1685480 RepID=A0A6D2IMA6_9BRAS|nr:unnamed protein product [Microthlaspi erraticum]
MEQQEEKIRKVYTRRRTQLKPTWSLPVDLTTEILLRLPEKAAARFRCMSKLWSSITTGPYFINLFETRSTRPSLVLCFIKDDNLCVYSIPQHTHTLGQESNKSYSSSQPIDSYSMKFPEEYSDLSPTESVQGLICLQGSGKPIVWNPSKRRLLTLPKPRLRWERIKVFLGYDPIEGKHKVMCLPLRRTGDVCLVLTLGSAQESWRTVKTNHIHRSIFGTDGRCINGVIYYTAYMYHTHAWVIMTFDVRSETFGRIELPPGACSLELPPGATRGKLMTYEGRLAYADRISPTKTDMMRLWILEKHKWSSSQDLLSPLGHFDKSAHIYFSLKGFTQAGEFVYVPNEFHRSLYILCWHPVRNSCRRFKFEGIAGDDESWLDIFVGEETYQLHVIPNHIESQVSL